MKKISHWATAGIIGVAAIAVVVATKTVPLSGLTGLLTASAVPISTPAKVACDTQFTAFPTNGVSVKTYGAKGDGKTDDTAALNTAIADITSKGLPVIIPAGTYMVSAAYTVGGVRPVSGSRIYLTNGATLKAIPNAVKSYGVVKIANASDVAIVGGVISGERSQHTGVGGEGGHAITVGSASHVVIKGVTAKDGWGDGLYVSKDSSDITACYDTMTNNRRNNISIVGGDHITIDHVNMIGANGTAPQAGIDIEPNGGKGYFVSNVTVSNSLSYGNHGDGMAIYGYFNPTSNITLQNNLIMSNAVLGIRANYADNVTLKNNTLFNSDTSKGAYNYNIFVDHGNNYVVDSNKIADSNVLMGILVSDETASASVTNNCISSGKMLYLSSKSANKNSNNNLNCSVPTPTPTYLDLTPPAIKLTGSTVSVPIGSQFVEPGATATDAKEGAVAVKTVGTIDTKKLGTYTLTYVAQDSVGNTSIASRTVKVVPLGPDTVAPVITMAGANPLTLTVGATFTDPGAGASDARDGAVAVTKTSTVNTAKVGTYTVTYKATDKAGNTATATRTVKVVAAKDTTAPVVTLYGTATMTIKAGTVFTDLGATAKDAVDGTLPVSKTGTVNTAVAGTYTITYTATDKSGNVGKAVRTVTVTPFVVTPTPTVPAYDDDVLPVTTRPTTGGSGSVSVVPNYNVTLFVSGIPGFSQSAPTYNTISGTHVAFTGSVQVSPTWAQGTIPPKGVDISLSKNGSIIACHRISDAQTTIGLANISFKTTSFAASDSIDVRALFAGSCPVTVMQ